MTLKAPFMISSRLLPAVQIGQATISLEPAGMDAHGRCRWRYYIDGPELEHSAQDLRSGVGEGHDYQKGMASLMAFLGAAAESEQQAIRTGVSGENSDLFPSAVNAWAYQHSDEIGILQCELEECKDLVTD